MKIEAAPDGRHKGLKQAKNNPEFAYDSSTVQCTQLHNAYSNHINCGYLKIESRKKAVSKAHDMGHRLENQADYKYDGSSNLINDRLA